MAREQPSKKESGRAGDSRLSVSQQYALAAKWANCLWRCNKHSMASWSREAMLLVHLELVQPPLRYCVVLGFSLKTPEFSSLGGDLMVRWYFPHSYLTGVYMLQQPATVLWGLSADSP